MFLHPDIQKIVNQEKIEARIMSLCKLAAADGDLDPKETKIIYKLAESYGISNEELRELFNNPPQDWKLLEIQNKKEKIEFIFDLILVMMADGKVAEEEMNLIINEILSLLGIWEDVFEEIFHRMGELTYQTQDKDEIVSIVHQEFKDKII